MSGDSSKPAFKTYKLSLEAYELLQNIERASRLVESAVTPKEIEDSYAILNKVRQIYASYIEALETLARQHGAQGIEPDITVRYE